MSDKQRARATRVYFVRHAESELNRENRISGQTDPGLTDEGRSHARLLADRLRDKGIEVVYTSGLRRAKETAFILNSALNVKLVEEAELAEIHLGEWEGKTPDEVNREYDNGYVKWLKGPGAAHIPGAEAVADFRSRVEKAFRRIVERNKGRTIAIVSHGGVLTSVIASILRADFDSVILHTSFGNTGVTLMERSLPDEAGGRGGRTRLVYVNDVSHIDGYDKSDHRPYRRRT